MSDSENESSDDQLKVVLLGEQCVGKTSIVIRYCNNEFTRQYFPTAGVDFFLKQLMLQKLKNITLKIWDIGGKSLFGKMLDKYLFGANIIILTYDVTNETTFECLTSWLESVKNIVKYHAKPPIIAVAGNKCDVEHQRVVRFERHQKLAHEYQLASYTVSARTGESINLMFQKLTADFLGIRLTKSQIEEFQSVVRAEISTYTSVPIHQTKQFTASKSAICLLQ